MIRQLSNLQSTTLIVACALTGLHFCPETLAHKLGKPVRVDLAQLADFVNREIQAQPSFQIQELLTMNFDLSFYDESLVVLGTANAQELLSMRKFSHILYWRYGYGILAFGETPSMSTPAYDGLIFDSSGQVVANISLKSLESQSPDKLREVLRRAINKLKNFRSQISWVSHLAWLSPGKLEQQMKFQQHVAFKSQGSSSSFRTRAYDSIPLFRIFGTGSNRPNWILVDLIEAPNRLISEMIHKTADAMSMFWPTHIGMEGKILLLSQAPNRKPSEQLIEVTQRDILYPLRNSSCDTELQLSSRNPVVAELERSLRLRQSASGSSEE